MLELRDFVLANEATVARAIRSAADEFSGSLPDVIVAVETAVGPSSEVIIKDGDSWYPDTNHAQ